MLRCDVLYPDEQGYQSVTRSNSIWRTGCTTGVHRLSLAASQCFLACPSSGIMARKQCFLICPFPENMTGKQCFLVCPPFENMARKQCFEVYELYYYGKEILMFDGLCAPTLSGYSRKPANL